MEQKNLTEKQKKALIELQRMIRKVLVANDLTVIVDVADATITAFDNKNINDLDIVWEGEDMSEHGYSEADWSKGFVLDKVPFRFFNSNYEKVVVC